MGTGLKIPLQPRPMYISQPGNRLEDTIAAQSHVHISAWVQTGRYHCSTETVTYLSLVKDWKTPLQPIAKYKS
ncbi:hypothetical protein XENTR_v10016088 [Xenopus tropicalis]|nr:hypothetical protein XENTR_v10016088 [Xenopus tropicalis]